MQQHEGRIGILSEYIHLIDHITKNLYDLGRSKNCNSIGSSFRYNKAPAAYPMILTFHSRLTNKGDNCDSR